MFQDPEEHKCGGCNWRVSTFYVYADSKEEAINLYDRYGGLCAYCFLDFLREYEVELTESTTSGDIIERKYIEEE